VGNPTPAHGFRPATIKRILGLLNELTVPTCIPATVALLVLGILTIAVGWCISIPPTLPGDEIYVVERVAGLTARTLANLPQMPDAPPASALNEAGVWLTAAGVLLLVIGFALKNSYRLICGRLVRSARDIRLLVADDAAAMGLAELPSAATPVMLLPPSASIQFAPHLRLPLDATFLQRTLPHCAERARELLALDHDCNINIDIARRLGNLRRDRGAPPLQRLRLRVDSRAQRLSIGRSDPGEFAGFASDMRLTSVPAARCRSLLRDQPPNKIRTFRLTGRPALVIVGLGDLGIELLNQLCAQAQSPALDPLRIVIVDSTAHSLARDLREAFPALSAVVEILPLALESGLPQFSQVLLTRLSNEGMMPLCIYIALTDDALVDAWERELALAGRAAGAPFALVLPVHRLGLPRTGRSLLAEEEVLDVLPQRQHAAYVQKLRDISPPNGVAMADWAHLPFEYQEDNRSAADHLWTAARDLNVSIVAGAAGLHSLPDDAKIEPLAMAEHRRWHANRALAGWRQGAARDESARTHPLLTQWTLLPESEREKNRNVIRELPDTLASAGYRLRPLANCAIPLNRGQLDVARATVSGACERLRREDPTALAHFVVIVESVEHFRLAQDLAARSDAVVSLVLPQSLGGLAVAAGQQPESATALALASWKVWLAQAEMVEQLLGGDSSLLENG
jgi:hypothetical protein